MSYAPGTLLIVRDYMQIITGLPDTSLGIVADTAHDGGYHCGWDRRRTVNGRLSDYSWQESSRDMSHRTDAAAAFDLGRFERIVGGHRVTWIDFSVWLVGQCAAGAPDTLDIREVIYTPDRRTVRRWDRVGRRNTGDSSHLTHTHISYFRDAENRDKLGPYHRFFGRYLKGDNTMFVKVSGQNEVYISDGFQRRHLTSYPALLAAQTAGYQLIEVPTVADLVALAGPLREPTFRTDDPSNGDSAPIVTVQVTARSQPQPDDVEAAAERAVRRILGQLEEAPNGAPEA